MSSEQVERIEWAWCCHASWRCLGIGVPGVIRNGVMLCERCDAEDEAKKSQSVRLNGYPLQYNSVTDNRDV